ncbi:MAG: hypothetical protein NDI77_10070 [Geobacteraceae bacterium]|nr:hypothetical protein [Geobacteraceae bacterium]
MTDCDLLDQCRFFNGQTVEMPSTVTALKTKYCRGGGYSSCTRHIISRKMGKEQVPEDLFPNQHDRLQEFLDFP